MLLRMTETRPASRNGTVVEIFEVGYAEDFPEPLGSMLLKAGWAERFSPEPAFEAMREALEEQDREHGDSDIEPLLESKMFNGSPENKMLNGSGDQKPAVTAPVIARKKKGKSRWGS